jgi:hypothetical protein
MRRYSGLQQYNESLIMAKEHGLKIIQRPGRFLVYRVIKDAPRDIYIGSRGSVDGLRQLVERASGSLR